MCSPPSYLGAVGFTLSQNLSLAEKEYTLMSADAGLLSAAIDSAVGFSRDEEICAKANPTMASASQPCAYNQFQCPSRFTKLYTCLPESLKWDGNIDCLDLADEIVCDVPTCGQWLKYVYGTFQFSQLS